MTDLIEKYAIIMAEGNNGGTWATHYTDSQKDLWRARAEKLIEDVLNGMVNNIIIMTDMTAHQKVLCMEKAEREAKAAIDRIYEFPNDRHAQEHYHRMVADKYLAMTTPN